MPASPTTTTTDAAIICLPGFRQTWGPGGSGLWTLYEELAAAYYDRRTHLVLLREWDSDAAATARLIASRSPRIVLAIAYSYGAGWGLPQLAEALAPPYQIDLAYLVDPVPRWGLLPAKLLSLTRWGDYELPPTVCAADYWRQLNAAPFGRRPVPHPDAPEPPVITPRRIYGTLANIQRHAKRDERPHTRVSAIDHSAIDDSAEIRREILASIAKLTAPPGG